MLQSIKEYRSCLRQTFLLAYSIILSLKTMLRFHNPFHLTPIFQSSIHSDAEHGHQLTTIPASIRYIILMLLQTPPSLMPSVMGSFCSRSWRQCEIPQLCMTLFSSHLNAIRLSLHCRTKMENNGYMRITFKPTRVHNRR